MVQTQRADYMRGNPIPQDAPSQLRLHFAVLRFAYGIFPGKSHARLLMPPVYLASSHLIDRPGVCTIRGGARYDIGACEKGFFI